MADAVANKKKTRNKKKSQAQGQNQVLAKVNPKPVKAKLNGHVEHQQTDNDQVDMDVSLINGLMEKVQLCNGHGKEQLTSSHVNGHAYNNNHLNTNNNNNNNHNNSNNNNELSINSAKSNNSNKNNNTSKAKSNHSKPKITQREAEEEELDPSVTTTPTKICTANTEATAATKTTKTSALAIATRGGIKPDRQEEQQQPQEEVPTTSAAAAAAASTTTTTTTTEPMAVSKLETEPVSVPANQLQLEPAITADEIVYKEYEAEHQMHDIMRLIQAELSEPYSIYTYRYFIYNWPKLCFLASHDNQYVGAIVCKLDMHMNVRRGYIAMLAVRKEYRKLKIGTTLVTKAIEAMLADNADEVVLETEMRNEPALRLYENLGFVRDKRLFRYYLNGVDALRLKLWFR
ncbi:CG11412 [Drosophila busckii]|uniref:N-terminal methionine N(alpha)-acetyltransferase NatC n=1 Tax=Drosophila busckii TaxID=30019 RepID=A0A0M4EHU2_DROBS|nr:N-alpha-acetyltransferase 30A [Drosophila busckii]XP_017850748.1 N-alpha-acetyltransferase 30A [Drosophila busckii]ALC48278.1 CG11412 [Drosophila busckii]